MDNDKTITIDKQSVYTPRVEKEKDLANSLFRGVYDSALRSLADICSAPIQTTDLDKRDSCNPVPEINPVIAFVGDRGAGKTSALLSFVEDIKRNKDSFLLNSAEGNAIKDYSFISLPLIDPSLLSKNETLLGSVIAHMQKYLEKLYRSRTFEFGSSNKGEKLSAIYEKLGKVYDSLRLLKQEKEGAFEEYGGIERLEALSVSYNLRNSFIDAVYRFLDLILDKKGMLVIPIDDLDMSLESGYDICEEIRSYFQIPRIVVVFSVRLTQLHSTLQQTFFRHFEKAYDKSSVVSAPDSPAGMAEKYLAKLFPINRRHMLPAFTISNIASYKLIDRCDDEKSEVKKPLAAIMLRLLYEKLGLILIPNSNGGHLLLPNSLRGMVHLYGLLRSMDDVFGNYEFAPLNFDEFSGQGDNARNARTRLSANLDLFEKVYLDDFLADVGNSECGGESLLSFFHLLIDTPWQLFNRQVARFVRKVMIGMKMLIENREDDGDSSRVSDEQSIEDICSPQTLSENVSIGDALYMLDRLEVWDDQGHATRFACAVRTLYSLRLVRMFFLDQDPEDMRQFIVQLNNPDTQRLVRTDATKTMRDWRERVMISKIHLDSDTTISFREFINTWSRKKYESKSNSPFMWLLRCMVWAGDRPIRRNSIFGWRNAGWTRPYLSTLDLLNNPNTNYITINYGAFLVNGLSPKFGIPSQLGNNKSTYSMIIPLYSSELISFIIRNSDKAARLVSKSVVKENGFFSMFTEFMHALERLIRFLNALESMPIRFENEIRKIISIADRDNQRNYDWDEVSETRTISNEDKNRLYSNLEDLRKQIKYKRNINNLQLYSERSIEQFINQQGLFSNGLRDVYLKELKDILEQGVNKQHIQELKSKFLDLLDKVQMEIDKAYE